MYSCSGWDAQSKRLEELFVPLQYVYVPAKLESERVDVEAMRLLWRIVGAPSSSRIDLELLGCVFSQTKPWLTVV
jgi:hypothetical protein